VSELENLVRQRRFDEIWRSREQVDEDRRNLDDAVASGRVDDSLARRLYQRSVDRYVKKVETLLNPPGVDEEDRNAYWHTVEIGRLDLPNGNTKHVEGLLGYLSLDEEITVQVQVAEREHYYDLGQARVVERSVQPSWSLLDSAVRTANAALADMGMEIDPTKQNDMYAVKRDPDDYPQPKSDDIPKPATGDN